MPCARHSWTRPGREVILCCRSVQRGQAAVAELAAEEPGWEDRCSVLEMDTSSDESVAAAAGAAAELLGGQKLYTGHNSIASVELLVFSTN